SSAELVIILRQEIEVLKKENLLLEHQVNYFKSMYENNILANKNKATSISGNESPPGAKTTTSPKVKVTTESPPGVKTTTSPNLEATTESSLPEAKDNTESTSIKAKAITGLSSPNPEVTTESPLNAEDTTGPKETESSLPTERTTESYKVQESILGVDNCIKNNDLLLPEIYTEYDILLPGSQLNLNQQKEVVHAITNFHKNEEEMMIVCEEDEEIQFLTKNSKDDNNEASTTSDNFSSTNEIKRSSPANSATDTASTSSTETTARSIQNLQVQGQGLEEELSVLDDEDGIITSGRREWTQQGRLPIAYVFQQRLNNNIQNLPNDITIISPPPTGKTPSINTLANDTISSESTIDNDIKQDDEITYPLKTTSSIFDNNNKITDNPFINLLPLIKSEMSKRFPPQKLNDDNIFSDFQAASDINSRKTMHPMNGFTSTSMNPLQQKQFVHSKSTSFDNTFSDLDPLHNK
ncbi:4103_t:CDS:2, partial [Entrophospora sp. SA101]